MTTRDPRSRPPGRPASQGSGRDPTQSLSLDPDDEVEPSNPSHPSLALGTHDAAGREERTRIESPQARGKTPVPPRPPTRPPPIPKNADDPDNHIGKTLGNYRVVELLGKGGMGYVYRAEHTKLGREVALKLLRSDYAKRKDAVARFIQEARTVNRVRHRNIVDVPDILELEDGTTCIVMEFLRGQSLGKWARTGIDLPRALAVLVQICDGLSAAHAVSVVHRDLKPDNVIVVPTSDGAELVKLLDFGVAKLLNRDDEDIGFQTAAGSVIGTPAYMSPEQAGGMVIDARSDIYSLGAIMYELFCGQPMFRGRSFGEYVRKHLTELPMRPRATPQGAQIDERLEAVILKCLEKDPNQRFGHILELRDALLALLGGLETHPPSYGALTQSGLRAPPLPSVPSMPAIPQVVTPTGHVSGHLSGGHPSMQYVPQYSGHYSQIVGLTPPPQPAPTPWWVWFIGGGVAIGLGVGAAVWFAGRGEDLPQVTAPTPTPVQPAEEPQPAVAPELPAVKPKQIELRFDSLPSGGVFADGKSAELCHTPCAFNIDTTDGGPTDRRTFIVKSTGYKDSVVDVDLTGKQREFSVRLEQLNPTVAPVTTKPTVEDPDKTSKVTKATASTKASKTTSKPDKAVVTEPPVVPEPAPQKDPADLEDPTDGKQPTEKIRKPGGTKIDAADTLDPFRRKRP